MLMRQKIYAKPLEERPFKPKGLVPDVHAVLLLTENILSSVLRKLPNEKTV